MAGGSESYWIMDESPKKATSLLNDFPFISNAAQLFFIEVQKKTSRVKIVPSDSASTRHTSATRQRRVGFTSTPLQQLLAALRVEARGRTVSKTDC